MGPNDFLLDFIADTTSSLSLDNWYDDAIFNFDDCIALCPPPSQVYSSSATSKEEECDLDNNIIESLLKTEQDSSIKPKKDDVTIATRKSLRKRKYLHTIFREDPKKRGLSKAKFDEVKDRLVVTAKKSVVSITMLPKKKSA